MNDYIRIEFKNGLFYIDINDLSSIKFVNDGNEIIGHLIYLIEKDDKMICKIRTLDQKVLDCISTDLKIYINY